MNKIIEKNEEDNNSQGSNNTLTSNSDNVNENNKRVKRTRNRPSKAERFCEEREELIKELEKMMGLYEHLFTHWRCDEMFNRRSKRSIIIHPRNVLSLLKHFWCAPEKQQHCFSWVSSSLVFKQTFLILSQELIKSRLMVSTSDKSS